MHTLLTLQFSRAGDRSHVDGAPSTKDSLSVRRLTGTEAPTATGLSGGSSDRPCDWPNILPSAIETAERSTLATRCDPCRRRHAASCMTDVTGESTRGLLQADQEGEEWEDAGKQSASFECGRAADSQLRHDIETSLGLVPSCPCHHHTNVCWKVADQIRRIGAKGRKALTPETSTRSLILDAQITLKGKVVVNAAAFVGEDPVEIR
ncbi:hypothetical protein NM688_g7353 [Phlebia brevispora]|uniref:Uncharacterized protein n=1 Tax=Phlebia brevispora TaxID=194682 RepID=A0ACC1S692_9APHY|nr:hypothetical protein NM688_g7353 [Phlebia brevispora]